LGEATEHEQLILSNSQFIQPDDEGFHLGCSTEDKISLYVGTLDILGVEVAMAIFLLTIVFSVISFIK
jgi:hypothetical protein